MRRGGQGAGGDYGNQQRDDRFQGRSQERPPAREPRVARETSGGEQSGWYSGGGGAGFGTTPEPERAAPAMADSGFRPPPKQESVEDAITPAWEAWAESEGVASSAAEGDATDFLSDSSQELSLQDLISSGKATWASGEDEGIGAIGIEELGDYADEVQGSGEGLSRGSSQGYTARQDDRQGGGGGLSNWESSWGLAGVQSCCSRRVHAINVVHIGIVNSMRAHPMCSLQYPRVSMHE